MRNPELCREVVRQLWPYLDGVLPDDERERVASHLADCDGCRSHYDFEREFIAAVRATRQSASVAEFEPLRQRVVAKLSEFGFTGS
ncbi:MAG: hypothetical protein NVS1B4_08340 [Gemmatimonadaceae bacterium]